MKKQNIFYLIIGLLLVATFFFQIIPIPVENIEGLSSDKFIYGGMYYTSILNELSVNNYLGSLSMLSIFAMFIFLNYYFVEDN
jgi:hypothetical protein